MLRRLYHRVLDLSASPRAPWWLALVAFAESSFFPVPPDALLLPMVAARPERAWRLAAVCTASSVLGALLGYAIGYALYQQVALPVIHFYHYDDAAAAVVDNLRVNGVWLVLAKGLTPIPFKIVTIAAGAVHLELVPFVLACIVTRGARFFIEAAILRRYGASVLRVVERRLAVVMLGSVAAIVAGFLLLKVI
jgi:membrane protein YqaA with SNARE-associated domain